MALRSELGRLLWLAAMLLPGAGQASPGMPAQGAGPDAGVAPPMSPESSFDEVVLNGEARATDTILVVAATADASLQVAAQPAPDAAVLRLIELLDDLDLLSARFEQRITDARGEVLREAAGALWAARPDRFRWEMERPFAELLVGDGSTLYLWDPDLEQVTIRPYDERLQGTPARLLSGSADDLVADFEVTRVAAEGTREVFELRPRSGEGLFDRMEMIFVDAVPQVLVIRDSLGQRTEVRLRDLQVGTAMAPELFEFEIPAGADVLREDPAFGASPLDD